MNIATTNPSTSARRTRNNQQKHWQVETTDVVSFTFKFLTTAKSKISDIEEENSPVVNNGESPNGKQEGTPQAIQIDLEEYIGQTLKELLKEGISMPGKDEKSSSHKRKKV